jgi:predicted ATPase
MTPDQITENIFDIVNQLNSGVSLISDADEKERVAKLNLNAGRKAKASTAYASACTYLSAGMDLVGCNAWERRYELVFALWLERAECEYLNGDLDKTEQLVAELLARAVSKIDKAAAPPEDPSPSHEGAVPAGRRQRAGVPASVRHRDAGSSDS